MVVHDTARGHLGAPWEILLIDDDKEDFILVRSMLDQAQSHAFNIRWASSYADGQKALESDGYHAVLVDYDLGEKTGIDIIREGTSRGYPAPFILYTGRGGYNVDLEAMQAGATLYLTKNEVNPLLLERSIRYAVELKQREQKLRAREAALEKTAQRLKTELAERERAEEAMRVSEERFAKAFNASPDALAMLRAADRTIQVVNRSFEQFFGYSQAEAVGKTSLDLNIFVRPAERDTAIKTIVEEGFLRDFELDLRTKSAEIRRVKLSVEVIEINGEPHWLVIVDNIHERKLTERALQESESRFEALVSASSQVLYRMSPDWTEMRQLEGGNFLADTVEPNSNWMEEYIHPDDQARVWQVIQDAIQNKAVFDLEHRVVRADGTLGWTASRAVPVLDADGEIREWFGAASDITERKRAEEAALYRQLQHRLIELREQEHLKISRDLHDGPVQDLIATTFAVRGLIMDHPTSSAVKELEQLEKDLQNQVAKWRNYAFTLRPPMLSHYGLGKTIESHAMNFQELYPEIRVRLQMDHSSSNLDEGVALALLRIYQEAMMNVRKHVLEDQIEIRVMLLREDDTVRLEVQDNGQGFVMPEAWLELVGSGHLGLVGMMERAASVGGKLDVYSAPGEGTRIVATVPAITRASFLDAGALREPLTSRD
jgi:PAS domain S-box-containing protein